MHDMLRCREFFKNWFPSKILWNTLEVPSHYKLLAWSCAKTKSSLIQPLKITLILWLIALCNGERWKMMKSSSLFSSGQLLAALAFGWVIIGNLPSRFRRISRVWIPNRWQFTLVFTKYCLMVSLLQKSSWLLVEVGIDRRALIQERSLGSVWILAGDWSVMS